MYFLSSLEIDDTNQISQLLYPDIDIENNKIPKSYSLPAPYRLVLSGIKTDEYDNYFSNCFMTPAANFYSQVNKDEAAEILSKISLHSHNFFEIMFVLSGEIYVNIENERHIYRKGSAAY